MTNFGAIAAAALALFGDFQDINSALKSLLQKLIDIFGNVDGYGDDLAAAQQSLDDVSGVKDAAINQILDWFDMGGIPTSGFGLAGDDDGSDDTINVSWSKALPNSNPHPGWYNNYKDFWWTVKANTTGNERDPMLRVLTLFEDEQSIKVQHPEFVYAPVVYVWVSASYPDTIIPIYYSHTSQAAENAVHIPELRPPASVAFASGATDLSVQVPAGEGKFWLQIASSDASSRASVLYEGPIDNPTSMPWIVDWDQLLPVQPMPVAVSAYVKAISSERTKAKDSKYATSTSSFNVLVLPANVTAVPDTVDTGFVLSWNQPGSSTTADYDIEVRNEGALIKPLTIKPQKASAGQRFAQVSSTAFTPGMYVTVRVRAHPPDGSPEGTISIYTAPTPCVISGLTQPTINESSSYWDISSQTLRLDLKIVFVWPTGASFRGFRDKDPTPIPPKSVSLEGELATVIFDGAALEYTHTHEKWPSVISVQAALVGNAWGPGTSPWTFPAAAADGLAPPVPVVDMSATIFTVSWQPVANADSTTVTLSSPTVPPVSVSMTATYPTSSLSFTPASFPRGFSANEKFRLTCESGAVHIRGGGTATGAYVLPDTDGWGTSTGPLPLINPSIVAANSTVACVARVPGQILDVWFTSTSGTVEAAHYDKAAPIGRQ